MLIPRAAPGHQAPAATVRVNTAHSPSNYRHRPRKSQKQCNTAALQPARPRELHPASTQQSREEHCGFVVFAARLKAPTAAFSPAPCPEPSPQLIREVCNGNADSPFSLVALAGAPTMQDIIQSGFWLTSRSTEQLKCFMNSTRTPEIQLRC